MRESSHWVLRTNPGLQEEATWTCSWHLKLLGFPRGSAGKESTCSVGDLGSIHGLGRSSGEGKGYPLQYSGLENFMDYSPWGHKESDMTEQLSFSLMPSNKLTF